MRKTLIIILLCLFFGDLISQSSCVTIKYDSIKMITPTDTSCHKMTNYFYFNKCSLILISETQMVYGILLPNINSFDVNGIRVLEDTGFLIEDGGIIYESPLHNKQLAVYYSKDMSQTKIMRKDKTGIIFYSTNKINK